MSSETDLIVYSMKGRVAYLSLNRPPANAYNIDFMRALHAAVIRANEDARIGAVIVKSESDRFFCAGADIHEFGENETAENQRMVDQARATVAAMEGSGKIFIAQIAGHALGGGLEIAMSCDVRFAARGDYKLGLPEIKLGLIPGNGGTQRLARLIGVGRALEILATGDSFSADDALRWGLINRLYELKDLEAKTLAFAQSIADGPGLAVAAAKQAVLLGVEKSLADGLAMEKQLADSLYETDDAREGFEAFLHKRLPKFTNS